jgi:hypothetical protein
VLDRVKYQKLRIFCSLLSLQAYWVKGNTGLVSERFQDAYYHSCPSVPNQHFYYDFIGPGPILRHSGEFGKYRLLLGGNTRFLPDGVNMGI